MKKDTGTSLVGVRGPYRRKRQRVRKTGVYLNVEHYFQATWQEQTRKGWKKRKAQFSIRQHGYAGALSLAIAARLQAEERGGRR
ncbi:MAG: hypothetical protein U0Y68_04040 [Blastocatellia bacterium]